MSLCEDAVNGFDLEKQIAPSIFAYNVCVNTTTGFTPFFFMYGREARLTVDAMLAAPKMRHPSYMEYVKKLSSTLRTVQRSAQLFTADSLYNRPHTVQQVIHQRRYENQVNAEIPFVNPPTGQPFPAKLRKPRR